MAFFDDNVLQPPVAGAAGAVVGLFNTPGKSWSERCFNLSAGLSMAWFVAPWLAGQFHITDKNGANAFAFMVGLMGMNIAAKLIDYAKRNGIMDIIAFARRDRSDDRSQKP